MHVINAPELPAPTLPLSHAAIVGDLVFCSGQIPQGADGVLLEGPVANLVDQVFANLAAVLSAAGSSLDRIARTTVYLTDFADFADMNAAYGRHLPHAPARTCIRVAGLPLGARLEIECVASITP